MRRTVERIFVFGASGHAKVAIDITERQGLYEIAFLVDEDPSLRGREIYGYKVLGSKQELMETCDSSLLRKGLVAIGSNAARVKIAQWLLDNGFELVTVVHPSAQLARGVFVAGGTVVMAGVIINSDAKVGENVVLNTGATIGHDCVIADGVHIAPGCHLCGNVTVGSKSFVGVGTIVIPGITIGREVTVGAGSTVIRDVPDCARVAGTPCRPISSR